MPTLPQPFIDSPVAGLEDPAPPPEPGLSSAETSTTPPRPPRPAWIEVDLKKLRQNFELINRDKPTALQVLSVVKDDGYGHGALAVAQTAVENGVGFLALSTVEEAVTLRDAGIQTRLLLLGDRHEAEFPWCIAHELTCCISEPHSARKLGELAAHADKRVPVHLKLNTGLNRYGVRWTDAAALAELICSTP